MSTTPEVAAPDAGSVSLDDWSAKQVTPLPRLAAGIVTSYFSFMIGLMVPLQLVLTLHLTRLANGGDATGAFGVVTGFGALVGLIANVVGGRWSDRTTWRLGRRRSWILIGAVVGGLFLVLISLTTAVWQVAIVWCCITAIFNFQLAATTALLSDQVPPARRGGVSGLIGLSSALGPLAGLTLVNSVEAGSPRQWHLLAIATAVLALLAVALIKEQRYELAKSDDQSSGLIKMLRSFSVNPRKHPAYWWAWLVRFLITFGFAASSYNAFFLMQHFGYTSDEVGGVVLTLSLISLAGLLLTAVGGGFLSDALKRQKPFVIAAGVLSGLGLVLMAFAPSIVFVYAAIAFLGLGGGLFLSIDTALCVRMLPSAADAGRDMAIINIANTVPQSLVPFCAPLLLALGSYSLLYCVLAVLCLLSVVAVMRLPEIGQENKPHRFIVPVNRDLVGKA